MIPLLSTVAWSVQGVQMTGIGLLTLLDLESLGAGTRDHIEKQTNPVVPCFEVCRQIPQLCVCRVLTELMALMKLLFVQQDKLDSRCDFPSSDIHLTNSSPNTDIWYRIPRLCCGRYLDTWSCDSQPGFARDFWADINAVAIRYSRGVYGR